MNHQLEQVIEQFHENCGKNSITTYDIFKGIKLAFVSLESEDFSFHHPALGHILEINYCKSGRIVWQMENGNSIYLGQSDFSLHTMDSCANSQISLPNGDYNGLTLFIDLQELSENLSDLLSGTGITGKLLVGKFCKNGTFTSLAGNEQTEGIFSAFFNLPENLQLPYWKLKTLELLLYLLHLETDSNPRLTEYQAEQIEIVRSIHEQLVGNLNLRFTIESLSKQYLMNATTLKKVFKAVYGTSIAAHIKQHRMEQAAKLLLNTQNDIIQIAQTVGYESQSRFSAAFKDYFQMLPTEYRKNFCSKEN
ncbi:MAG: AraC family transcriptional regulator [Lachnospiraceae bacterium]|nr:AraC family transcriptional regulator [Lachnospiraceae bacterium]